ncbi:hypothetical protein E2C01_030875 [Portunus trituberculatus]|uniref:Uncharacterized protein n=1 Tax=Portunus trituberculatus TaxID=210409 RepID=A0A5B7ERK8_PORTR|nr:hypothetical protein [Portunus trituberculatus]
MDPSATTRYNIVVATKKVARACEVSSRSNNKPVCWSQVGHSGTEEEEEEEQQQQQEQDKEKPEQEESTLTGTDFDTIRGPVKLLVFK